MIKVTFPDGSVREFAKGITGLQLAESISSRLAQEVLAITVNKNDVASSYTVVNNNNNTIVASATNTTGIEQYSLLKTDLSAHLS